MRSDLLSMIYGWFNVCVCVCLIPKIEMKIEKNFQGSQKSYEPKLSNFPKRLCIQNISSKSRQPYKWNCSSKRLNLCNENTIGLFENEVMATKETFIKKKILFLGLAPGFLSQFLNIQSNLVITNSTGPQKYVHVPWYREIVITLEG